MRLFFLDAWFQNDDTCHRKDKLLGEQREAVKQSEPAAKGFSPDHGGSYRTLAELLAAQGATTGFGLLTRIAFEIDGLTWHLPSVIPVQQFEDDLLRQNSLVHQGWSVFRWTDRELLNEPERVKEQLALFLESIPGLLSFDDFLPKQTGEVFELRPHQKDALDSLEQMRTERKTIALLTHAQGAGKTIVAIADAKRLGGRVLFVAHRRELVTQAYDKLRELWPEATTGRPRRRIVEFEQGGKARAEYGEGLLVRLAGDLTAAYGRGFSKTNLFQMRGFHLGWEIFQTPSGILEARVRLPQEAGNRTATIFQTPSGILTPAAIAQTLSAQLEPGTSPSHSQGVPVAAFPLSWSHYVRLMSVAKPHARAFYETEAIRGGWSVRQLDRQIGTQFFERTAHSKQQSAMLARGQKPRPEDAVSVQGEVRDPYLLEFLDLKDEYSESELEEALIRHLESFLLELGAGFAFVARQKRIRIGQRCYRIDLLLFHRGLRCLVVIDLKTIAAGDASRAGADEARKLSGRDERRRDDDR